MGYKLIERCFVRSGFT